MNKIQKTHSGQNWKILRMAFSKNSKTQKWPPKTPKIKNQRRGALMNELINSFLCQLSSNPSGGARRKGA